MWTIWARGKLSADAEAVLRALITGSSLKSHRDLDGRKVYRLHALDGGQEVLRKAVVDGLRRRGLIVSNQKFPAATYVLTEKGKARAVLLVEAQNKLNPVSANRA